MKYLYTILFCAITVFGFSQIPVDTADFKIILRVDSGDTLHFKRYEKITYEFIADLEKQREIDSLNVVAVQNAAAAALLRQEEYNDPSLNKENATKED